MSTEWVYFLDQINETIRIWELDGCDFPVFRGHADQDWNLEPSLMRIKKKLTPEEYEGLESSLYFDFVTYSAKFSKFSSSWEVVFEMRHHGLPTRLLDWSENFSMALYFALAECAPSPTIWMLNPYKLNEITMGEACLTNPIAGLKFNYENGFLNENAATEIDKALQFNRTEPVPFDKPIAIVPPLSSDRLFAQKGLFTLQGKANNTPLNHEISLKDCFKKFTIQPKALEDARDFCQLSGINEFTAYPDLDGLSRHLQTRYKISATDLKEKEKG